MIGSANIAPAKTPAINFVLNFIAKIQFPIVPVPPLDSTIYGSSRGHAGDRANVAHLAGLKSPRRYGNTAQAPRQVQLAVTYEHRRGAEHHRAGPENEDRVENRPHDFEDQRRVVFEDHVCETGPEG